MLYIHKKGKRRIHPHVFLLVFHQLLPLTFFRGTNIFSRRCNTLEHTDSPNIRIEKSFVVGLTHFALDQQLIVSSAAPLTSLILVNRETLL